MTLHACKRLTKGCYRCHLGVDEMRGALTDMSNELIGIRAVIDLLQDRDRELQQDIRDTQREIDRWDMGLATTPADRAPGTAEGGGL